MEKIDLAIASLEEVSEFTEEDNAQHVFKKIESFQAWHHIWLSYEGGALHSIPGIGKI
jgi:hypothetical protein